MKQEKVQEKVQEELAKELAAEAEKLNFNGLAHYLAVVNADNRLKHLEDLDFAVAAIADFDNGLTIGFMDGAEWAQMFIVNKARRWLKENAHFYVSDFTGTLDENKLIEDFKKAMEE